jgi:tRNA-dihydrouridine synthase
MLQETGCDAVMIGRAAIGNPWIFAATDRKSVPVSELFSVISQHFNMMIDLYGPGVAVPMFRKHLIRYLQGFLETPAIRRHIFTISDPGVLLQEVKNLVDQK